MMKRKEINIFGTSFLDLLSGALGAVLILFIIIPKMSSEQQSALEQIEQLDVQVTELEALLEQARNSIPAELFEQIEQQMEAMQNTIAELSQRVEELQQQLARTEAENQQLEQEMEQTQRQLQQTQQQLQQQQAQNRNIADGKVFGMTAKLGVVCIWTENADVDLHVKNLETGVICNYNQRITNFGNLSEDILSRTSGDDDRYELFYQSEIKPGRYLVYVNLYGGESNNATIDGYAIIFPGTQNQKKIDFRQIRLTSTGQTINIGTLTVTNNNITLEQ
jgi:Skp family chaperone for outer membrane proteins